MIRYLPLAVAMVALVAGLSSPNEITIADFYRRSANGDAVRLTQHMPLEQAELSGNPADMTSNSMHSPIAHAGHRVKE